MVIDLDAIERVARAATPGPWRWDHEDMTLSGSGGLVACGDGERIHIDDEDAEHIAQCSPDVVLALVARIRELEERLGLSNAEHADDCMMEIGKRAGYWNCDCGAVK